MKCNSNAAEDVKHIPCLSSVQLTLAKQGCSGQTVLLSFVLLPSYLYIFKYIYTYLYIIFMIATGIVILAR